MSLIEKIEVEIKESEQYGCEAEYRAGLYKAKEFILSEQKKPTYEQLKYVYDLQCGVVKMLDKSNGELSDRIVKAEGLMSERVIKSPTVGDKIRESNESTTEFIKIQFGDDRVITSEGTFDIDDYFNQPYKE